MSTADSKSLWQSIKHDDFYLFWETQQRIVKPNSPYRRIPLRIYLPQVSSPLQQPVPPKTEIGRPQTLGSALHLLLPELFPSTRTCHLALPVAHGVTVSMLIPLEEALRGGFGSPDGWFNVVIILMI
jgi:autophagy-related protein 5